MRGLVFLSSVKHFLGHNEKQFSTKKKKVAVNIQVSLNCPMTLCHRGDCRGQKARG